MMTELLKPTTRMISWRRSWKKRRPSTINNLILTLVVIPSLILPPPIMIPTTRSSQKGPEWKTHNKWENLIWCSGMIKLHTRLKTKIRTRKKLWTPSIMGSNQTYPISALAMMEAATPHKIRLALLISKPPWSQLIKIKCLTSEVLTSKWALLPIQSTSPRIKLSTKRKPWRWTRQKAIERVIWTWTWTRIITSPARMEDSLRRKMGARRKH